jgi:hypothetical protein
MRTEKTKEFAAATRADTRVTRLGAFSPIWVNFFVFGSCLKIKEVAQMFGSTLSTVKVMY